MTASPAAIAGAERMGRRAGEAWSTTGLPSPNPFRVAELAAAWRRGYFATARPRG